ncbi:hypothetical protein L1049_019057 [Liquidambar formosana]|uniref:Uncharacterized protein n=1 Tax=Liquidambar formosana TaxID=63359 RepID=A0AAP0RCV6_LIQFO
MPSKRKSPSKPPSSSPPRSSKADFPKKPKKLEDSENGFHGEVFLPPEANRSHEQAYASSSSRKVKKMKRLRVDSSGMLSQMKKLGNGGRSDTRGNRLLHQKAQITMIPRCCKLDATIHRRRLMGASYLTFMMMPT